MAGEICDCVRFARDAARGERDPEARPGMSSRRVAAAGRLNVLATTCASSVHEVAGLVSFTAGTWLLGNAAQQSHENPREAELSTCASACS